MKRALRPKETDHFHITVYKNICGGSPIIKGTRISVANIAGYYLMGLTPEEIQRELPHLRLAQVFDALAYYPDHREMIEREREQDREDDEHIHLALEEALRARGVDVLTTREAGKTGLDF